MCDENIETLYTGLEFIQESNGKCYIDSKTFKSQYNLHKHKKCNLKILMNMVSKLPISENPLPFMEITTTRNLGNGLLVTTIDIDSFSHRDIKAYIAFNLTSAEHQRCVDEYIEWTDEDDVSVSFLQYRDVTVIGSNEDKRSIKLPTPHALLGAVMMCDNFEIMVRDN